MNESRWDRIVDLFTEARQLSTESRQAFLDRECADDSGLRVEVEDMLRADGSTDDLASFASRLEARPGGVTAGHRVGQYAVIERIGTGGMGEVYLAERAGDDYRQRVALKILRSDLSIPSLAERFRTERQILAQLQHPNVCTLLDGGVTEDGRPFLVMQYEPGVPVTDYADDHQLAIEERLELFATICDAVQYAHSNLVVHRDLKPSNVIVNESGQPKLLDFGIAKILDESKSGSSQTTDVRMLTPEHAAPEQIRGEGVTTSTDVYALGILLYELLAGQRPFQASDTSPLEFQRMVCEEEPTRPSVGAERALRGAGRDQTDIAARRSTGPVVLIKTLTGDLDQIVLKSLRKEPSRRYESAGQLAADVRRYLDGMPVWAQPDSAGYRARKFVARHRWGVAAAAAFVILLAGFGVTAAVQRNQVLAQMAVAERELATSVSVTRFLVDIFEANDPDEAMGEQLTASDLLERGVERVDTLASDPTTHARVLHTLGRVYMSLGDYGAAEPLVLRALEIGRADPNMKPEDLASLWASLSQLQTDLGQFEESRIAAEEALAIRQELFEDTHPAVLSGLNTLARSLKELGDFDEAEAIYRRATAAEAELYDEMDPRLVTNLYNLARVLSSKGEYAEARPIYERLAEVERAAYPEGHPDLAITLTGLATSMYRAGESKDAEPVLMEALEMRRKFLPPDHPGIGTTLVSLGLVQGAQRRWEQAAQSLQDASDIYEAAFGPDHPNVASAVYNLGRVYARSGRPEQAEEAYSRALDIRTRSLGDDHSQTAFVEFYLGLLLLDQGRHAESERLMLSAAETWTYRLGAGYAWEAEVSEGLARLYTELGQPEKARLYLERVEATPETEPAGAR